MAANSTIEAISIAPAAAAAAPGERFILAGAVERAQIRPCPPLGKGSPSAGGGRNPTACAWGGARPRQGRGGAEREYAAPPGNGGPGRGPETRLQGPA